MIGRRRCKQWDLILAFFISIYRLFLGSFLPPAFWERRGGEGVGVFLCYQKSTLSDLDVSSGKKKNIFLGKIHRL